MATSPGRSALRLVAAAVAVLLLLLGACESGSAPDCDAVTWADAPGWTAHVCYPWAGHG